MTVLDTEKQPPLYFHATLSLQHDTAVEVSTTPLLFNSARKFVERVRYLINNIRKVLLIYDRYRSHMSFQAIKILSDGNVEAYALLSHTSGITQPLDVSAFAPFKHHVNEELRINASSTVSGFHPEISFF